MSELPGWNNIPGPTVKLPTLPPPRTRGVSELVRSQTPEGQYFTFNMGGHEFRAWVSVGGDSARVWVDGVEYEKKSKQRSKE